MQRLSATPFGQRPVTAGLIKAVQAANDRPAVPHINKWEVFRQLCEARLAYGLTDRDLGVLNALLSFHQQTNLGDNADLVVFPSNRALALRAHGMAESTLRRHLAALVGAGVILRHDSPNGKRYAARDGDGEVVRAFGFDLRPLLVKSCEIARYAVEARAAADRIKRLREEISLMKRDAVKFALYGQEEGLPGDWDARLEDLMEVHKQMRRKLDAVQLVEVREITSGLLDEVTGMLSSDTKEMSGNDVIYERQLQNSKPESYDLEPSLEQERVAGKAHHDQAAVPKVPLGLVMKACPDIEPYAKEDVKDWHQLVSLAGFIRGMMGISADAWNYAQETMGQATAAIAVCCILQKVDEIRSPGGYLRKLSQMAAEQKFSAGPMVMALLNGGKG